MFLFQQAAKFALKNEGKQKHKERREPGYTSETKIKNNSEQVMYNITEFIIGLYITKTHTTFDLSQKPVHY